MPTATPCPELDALQRLALNQSEPGEALQLHKHLVHCAPCAQMVRSLKDAAQALGAAPASAGAACEHTASSVATASHVVASSSPASPDATLPIHGTAPGFSFLAAPESTDELGRLGPYRILKKLGQGGMGMVFAAEDIELRRKVALKVMLPEAAQDAIGRERFKLEARAAAAVEHEHIVTIYQVGEHNGVPFLAMHLLHGETLRDALRREEKLPLREALRIGREVATGLSAAHGQGLIHRDIKPANIWLETRTRRVKILDFGLARSTSEHARHLTQTGLVVGTVGYMAPEQARGHGADSRSDLFSLGCVLYETSTGHEPFPGTDTMARLTALAVEKPVPPSKHNKALPSHFSDLVLWLLAKDPNDRPRSAQAVADALQAIEQQRGGNSTLRRRDLRPGDVADLLRTGGAGVPEQSQASAAGQSAQRPASSIRQWLVLLLGLVVIGVGSFVVGKVLLKLAN